MLWEIQFALCFANTEFCFDVTLCWMILCCVSMTLCCVSIIQCCVSIRLCCVLTILCCNSRILCCPSIILCCVLTIALLCFDNTVLRCVWKSVCYVCIYGPPYFAQPSYF